MGRGLPTAAFLGPHTTSQQQAQQKAKSSTKRLGGKREEKYRSWRSVAERGALPPDPRPAGGPGRSLRPLHEAAGLVAARRRKPSLSRHHASREAPTVGRRSVVVRDDGTNDASQKLGARGATAREIALTSELLVRPSPLTAPSSAHVAPREPRSGASESQEPKELTSRSSRESSVDETRSERCRKSILGTSPTTILP